MEVRESRPEIRRLDQVGQGVVERDRCVEGA